MSRIVRATAVALALLVLAVAAGCSGCDLFPKPGGRDRDGAASGDARVGDTAAWFAVPPADRTLEPAELLDVRVERVDVPASVLCLWVGDTAVRVIQASQIAGADTPEDFSDDVHQVRMLLPVWSPGTYTLAFGNETEIRSNTFDIDVVVPERAMPREAVADLMASALGHVVTDTRAIFESPDPEWQDMLSDAYTPEDRARIAEWFDALGRAAAQTRADYMAVPEEDERTLQAVLHNSGTIEWLQAIQRGSSDWPSRAITLTEAIHRPIHRGLFQLDLTSFALHLGSVALDVVGLITAVTGAAPLATVSFGAKIVALGVKYVIDTFIPTDLMEMEENDQLQMFAGEGDKWLYWGEFTTQNTAAGGLRSFSDIVVAGIAEALPEPAEGLVPFLQTLLRDMLTHLGFSFANDIEGGAFNASTIKTILDMRVYSLTLADMLQFTPFIGGGVSWALSWVDFEVVSGIHIVESRPDFAADARLGITWAADSIAVLGITYPGLAPIETAYVTIRGRGLRFVSREGRIYTFPGITNVYLQHGEKPILSRPTPGDPNSVISDESYIIPYARTAAGATEGAWIGRTTPVERVYDITIRDLFDSGFDGSAVTILVNDAPVYTDLAVPSTATRYPVSLRPGLNTITVVGVYGHTIRCGTAGTPICAELGIPDAMNADTTKGIYIDGGGRVTVRVWTPPALD